MALIVGGGTEWAMAWLFKGIVAVLVASGGAYALIANGSDVYLVQETMRQLQAAAQSRQLDRAAATGKPAGAGTEFDARALAVTQAEPFRAPFEASGASTGGTASVRTAQAPAAGPGASVPLPGVRAATPAEAAPRTGLGGQGRDGEARRRLATAIQTELRRVGCYAGDIDGEWSAQTQRAMRAFNQRVSTTLSVEHPDYILLTLLQGHAAKACGATCPLGEVEAANGSCKPRSVVAEARREAVTAEPAPWAKAIADTVKSGQRSGLPAGLAATGSLPDRGATVDRQRAAADPKAHGAEGTARADAQERQRRKAAADKAVAGAEATRAAAAAERERIAALDARKRELAAEAEARAEAERLARLAAAEKARVEAEARRQAELAALAERRRREAEAVRSAVEPQRQLVAAAAGSAATTVAAIAIAPKLAPEPGLPAATDPATRPARAAEPPRDGPRDALGNGGRATVKGSGNGNGGKASGNDNGNAKPRFVARFVPPPTYRVGRLPPSPPPAARPPASVRAPVVYVRRAPSPHAVFHHTQRHAP
jgi:hypothetical protein